MKHITCCNICNSPNLTEKDSFILCNNCGYQKSRVIPRKLDTYYNNKDIGLQVQNILESTSSTTIGRYHKVAMSFLKRKKIQTICDIGCGTGAFLRCVNKNTKYLYGYDINKQHVALSNDKYHLQNIRYADSLAMYCKKVKIKKSFFDVITAFEVIEHVQDVNKFVKDISLYLKKEGYVIISCPNSDRLRLHERWDYPPIHLSRFNRSSIQKLFEQYGFVTKKWLSYNELGYYSNNFIHNISATQTVLQEIISHPSTSLSMKQKILQNIVFVKKLLCKIIDVPLYLFLLSQKNKGHTMVFIAQKI